MRLPLVPKPLSDFLPVYVDVVLRCRVVRREPVLGVLVVERPRGDDDEECEHGAGEANVEGESNILLQEADDEGDDLCLSVY
jgi:hypothetical protein